MAYGQNARSCDPLIQFVLICINLLSGGEDIFGFSSDGVTTGFWQGLTVVGGGITGY